VADRSFDRRADPCTAKDALLAAFAAAKPGRPSDPSDAELEAARAEIARLEEAVKEQAIELVVLQGKCESC
jgi:transposase